MKNLPKLKYTKVIVLIAMIAVLTTLYARQYCYKSDALRLENNKDRVIVTDEPYQIESVVNDVTLKGKKCIVLQGHSLGDSDDNEERFLTQKDFSVANSIYIIGEDFVLSEDIKMPANCILEFEGGSLSGASITGNNTSIKPADYSIFNDCVIKNFNLPYVDPRWVGAIPDFNEKTRKGTDNSVYFQRAYDNIVENHPGIDLYIVGKYYIAHTVTFRSQCHIRGVHNNTRGYETQDIEKDSDYGNSNSLIAIGDCPAFKIVGNETKTRTWADLSIEHIRFLGLNRKKSIAIQYEAAGSPTRPASIEKCEASNLLCFLYAKAKGHSTVGNLTISGNNIYRCEKAIYAVSEPEQNMGFTALKIENNVIEHNGDKCIYLNKCFGPIIIDNNILEGQSNPIFITSPYYCETNYVISYNYFEHSDDNDKKIYIDGYLTTEGGDYDHAYFLTNVEIYGNTSVYGFAVELNGVVVKRLDRIDTPTKGRTNFSTFTKCLFEDVELSDVYAIQFNDWNFSTRYPTSKIVRKNAIINVVGNDLLSFDDCEGCAHTNKNTKATFAIERDAGGDNYLLVTKMRPHFTQQNKKIFFRYVINKKKYSFSAMLPREIPYYAFLVGKKEKPNKTSYGMEFNAMNYGTDIEMSNVTFYKTVEGPLYNFPHLLKPYAKK